MFAVMIVKYFVIPKMYQLNYTAIPFSVFLFAFKQFSIWFSFIKELHA